MLRRNLLIYGLGGIVAPFIGIKAHRPAHHGHGSVLMRRQLLPALGMVLVFTVLTGLAYPLVVTGIAQAAFGDKADGSLIERDGQVVGSRLDRPAVHRTRVLPSAPVGHRVRPGARLRLRFQRGADQRAVPRRRGRSGDDRRGRVRDQRCRRPRPRLPGGERARRRRPRARRRRHRVEQQPRPAHLGGQRPHPGGAGRRDPRARVGAWCSTSSTSTPPAGPSASSASRGSTCSS